MKGGKGQEISYLDLSSPLTVSNLEHDVRAGGVHYKNLLEYVTKRPSHLTVIKTNNRERGLMAVNYLAAIYNSIESVNTEPDFDNPGDLFSATRSECSFGDDTDNFYFNKDEDDILEEAEPEEEWVESRWRLPVIPYEDIFAHEDAAMSTFDVGPFAMGGINHMQKESPYWLSTTREPVCITRSMKIPLFGTNPYNHPTLADNLRRFSSNAHVYLLIVNDLELLQDDYSDCFGERIEKELCELILEYIAGTVEVNSSESALTQFHETVFRNHVENLGCSLAKNFPRAAIVNRILAIHNPAKSELMEKVIRYVIAQNPDVITLKKQHFDILDKFKLIGANDVTEPKSAKTLSEEIVGLESVKEQIHNIICVMKYNKRREEMGLGKCDYHNVHLLLGAPGTAKTTIAQLFGHMMMEEHLLPGNRFISINGAELKGMYVGHTAPRVHALFQENDVILIDEAYSITSPGDSDSYSEEAISQLIIEIEKHGMDKLVMFAGYGGKHVSEKNNKMKDFINANPGIRSRINSTIYFDSYTEDQMINIFHSMAAQKHFTVDSNGDRELYQFFHSRIQDANFGNGREARSLLENVIAQAAGRTMKLKDGQITKSALSTLTCEDIHNAIVFMTKGYEIQKGTGKKKCGFTTNY